MSNAKHTPGPWTANQTAYRDGSIDILSVNLQEKDHCYTHSLVATVKPHTQNFGDWRMRSKDEVRSTANLIAAAPNVLRELEHLVKLLEPHLAALNVPGLATLNGAKAAIAKAKGE